MLFVPLAIFFSFSYAQAQDSSQDAAEMARQERARKANEQKTLPHVYTEDDLKRDRILTPEDQARVEARKKMKNATPGQQNAESLPADGDQQTESLGEIARRYRQEQAAREAEEALKKGFAPFPYAILEQSVAAPKPEIVPLDGNNQRINPLALKDVAPMTGPAVPSRREGGRVRISPFQPRPMMALPPAARVAPVNPATPAKVQPRVSPAAVAPVVPSGWKRIDVQRGDSWWRLAGQYLGSGARWQELRRMNPDTKEPDNLLMLGSTILVPENASPRTAPPKGTVLVKKGDTLWSVARERLGHGSSWTCLAKANAEITAYTRLAIGSMLQLPSAELLQSCQVQPGKSVSR